MRTTISLDDQLGRTARRRAHAEGLSLSAYIARLLAADLAAAPSMPAPPFRLIVVGGGGPLPGVDLDRSSGLIAQEDEEQYRSAGE